MGDVRNRCFPGMAGVSSRRDQDCDNRLEFTQSNPANFGCHLHTAHAAYPSVYPLRTSFRRDQVTQSNETTGFCFWKLRTGNQLASISLGLAVCARDRRVGHNPSCGIHIIATLSTARWQPLSTLLYQDALGFLRKQCHRASCGCTRQNVHVTNEDRFVLFGRIRLPPCTLPFPHRRGNEHPGS